MRRQLIYPQGSISKALQYGMLSTFILTALADVFALALTFRSTP